tara:strand:- start:168 stop:422 length:255 start_codon:yes stop_codon:yes gene_type:complete
MTKEQNKQRTAGPPSAKEKKKESAVMVIEMGTDGPKAIRKKKIIDSMGNVEIQDMAKGGRVGYRMGGKCKLAKRGKGKAYGKNS